MCSGKRWYQSAERERGGHQFFHARPPFRLVALQRRGNLPQVDVSQIVGKRQGVLQRQACA